MLHKPAAQSGPDHSSGQKARLGTILCLSYALIYAGFVAINLLKPTLMEKQILFGVNFATIYGFALIFIALILALVYNRFCSKLEASLNSKSKEAK